MAEAIELSDSMTLSQEHLTVLLDSLCEIAGKWEEIATYLPNWNRKSISVIKFQQSDADKKLFEIMKRWLNEANPQPTVKDLVDALRSPFLSQNKIALEIERKFSVMSFQKSVSLSAAGQQSNSSYERFESSPAKLAEDASEISTQINQFSSQHSLDQSQGNYTCPDSESASAYECCCDEQCSIVDIASGKCPTSKSTPTHYPYLAAQHLSETEKHLLCGHLQYQFQEISMKYADLVDSIQESLKQRGVEVLELTRKLMSLKGFIPHGEKDAHLLLQDRISEMKGAKTTDDVFDILSDYSSFFSYKIIKHIVKRLGTDCDKVNLKSYEDDFTEYCRRSIFECPFHICTKKSPHFAELVMKVVSDSMIKPYSMKAVELFQAEVSSLLCISKYTLKLCSVEEGCLQLTFQFPCFLSALLFPLSADQVKHLKDLGVTKVMCDGISQLPEMVASSQESYSKKSLESVKCLSESLHQLDITEEEKIEQATYEKQKGDAHFIKAEYKLAVESYTKAMELDPSNALTATSKANALFQQELYKDAEECCSLSLELDKCNSKAYFIRARAKNKLGKIEDAVKDFNTALKLDPNNNEAKIEVARLEGELRRRAKLKQDEIKQAILECVTESDIAPSECTGEVCKLPHQPLPELEVVKILDEWESLRALIGEEVLMSSNLSQRVPVSIFEKEGSVIGLFFSGIWCPPSAAFTPELITWYNNFKKRPNGDLLDIIFISSDEDKASWKEYSAKMPWYGVHFDDNKRKTILHTKYNIVAIPTLIFVDGKTGKVITEEGRSIIRKDPTGDEFPWKPRPFSEIITGAKFIDKNEKERTWEQLQGKVIGLFFSGYRSSPGISFTFRLIDIYNKLKEANKEFEIIYVSLDENKQEWKAYSDLMPWISFPYGDPCIEYLQNLFQVDDDSDIPKLILLDEKCGQITTKGCACVDSDPNGENFPWYVNTLTKLTFDNLAKSSPAYLIWFVPSSLKKKACEVLRPLAKEYISKKAEENMKVKLLFLIAGEENEVSEAIRSFADLPSEVLLLAILDKAHNQVHVSDSSDVTEENARKFVYAYLKKQLLGRSLKV